MRKILQTSPCKYMSWFNSISRQCSTRRSSVLESMGRKVIWESRTAWSRRRSTGLPSRGREFRFVLRCGGGGRGGGGGGLDFGVNGGAAAGGVGFDDEGLGGFGVEAEEVGVLGIRRQGRRRSRGSDAGVDGGGDGDFHGLVGGVVWFGFDQFGAVVCDDLQGPAGAEFFGVNRYFHFAAGAGFYVRDAFERKIKADQLDVALAVGGDTEGETGDDDREGAERQAIVMVLGTGIHLFADADAVAAGGGDAEIEQGIAAVEAVVRGEQSAVRVKQGERDAGFGADGFGGEIEVEGFTGLGVEFDLVGIAGGVEGAPEADGELEEAGGGGGLGGARFGLGRGGGGSRPSRGFGFVGLGEVVHVELEFAALAIGTFDGDFVGAAGESRGGGDGDPGFVGGGGRGLQEGAFEGGVVQG